MSSRLINSETICDLQGQPLHPDAAVLLKALDKLLTVGAYYSAEHEQYLQAAMKARDTIVGVIGTRSNYVSIEITARGMMIGHQDIDPRHRNVRLLHDLLVPLNIARLEIDGTLTPEDLRQALAALHHHKAALGQVNSFQEIVIADLPASVRAISFSVLRRSETETTGGGGGVSTLDELLGKWDESPVTKVSQPALTDSAQLSQKFLDLITQIIANLENLVGTNDFQIGDGAERSYVTIDDLVTLKHALAHLVEANPDPANLALLISQAQRALGLSRDAKSVELVFQILKKDLAENGTAGATPPQRRSSATKYKLTVAELLDKVDSLAAGSDPVPEPRSGSCANQLGIVLQLLRLDPPRTLRTALISTVEQIVVQPGFTEQHLHLFAQAAISVVEQEELSVCDELLPIYTGLLRQKRPAVVSLFWVDLIAATTPEKLAAIWPHLINDILLGLGPASPELITSLAVAAGQLPLATARTVGSRLEKQPALQGRTAAPDLLVAPLPKIHSVVAVLLASPLKEWLGDAVYHNLRKRPLSSLVDLMISALGDHDPQYNDFYLELIQHGQSTEPPASLREPAARILQERLDNLPTDQRAREWVPRALTELAHLAPDQAQPLLDQVQNEKKFFFFKAWPAAARAAAGRALASSDQEEH